MGLARKILYCEFSPLLLLGLCFIVVVNASTVVVDSPFGKIQGVKNIADENSGQSYLSFKGIPYAKPPVGDLRFAKPQPHPKIAGTFNATNHDKIICPHSDKLTYGEKDFTEDCLILNIYMRDIDLADPLKKVMVFIHGGGFKTGYSTFHDPTSLVIEQNIITVTINYRIGILGFLSTENEASPGNYGLWDQTLAIKWVKDNIRAFGGDPDDIAIAGESAGGVSVGLQIISPHTKGLFTKAYAQSRTATSNIALSFNAKNDALSVAKSTGCWDKYVKDDISVQESNTVIDCLRNVPLSAISAYSGFSLIAIQFAPRVDGDFISDIPAKLLKDDVYLDSIGFYDRTYLVGINNNEAQASDTYLQVIKTVVSLDPGTQQKDRETAVKSFLARAENEYTKSRLGEIAVLDKNVSQEIASFYKRRFANEQSFIEMTSDIGFLIPALDLVIAASRRESCKSYFLYFNYFPEFMRGSYIGVPHGTDLLFLFDMEISSLESIINAGMQSPMGADDLEMRSMFISLIGEFVKSGNPGLALNNIIPCGWPKYDVTNSQYLNLNSKPWIGSFLEKDKQDLWFRTVPRLMGETEVPDDNTGCLGNGMPPFASCCHVVAFSIVFALFNMLFLF